MKNLNSGFGLVLISGLRRAKIKETFLGVRVPSNHPIKVAGSQKKNSAFFTSKTEQKEKTKIKLHVSVLKPLLTLPKEKGRGEGRRGRAGREGINPPFHLFDLRGKQTNKLNSFLTHMSARELLTIVAIIKIDICIPLHLLYMWYMWNFPH